jgi:hypothetical protein
MPRRQVCGYNGHAGSLLMLIQRANKLCAEPTLYQARALGQWVGRAVSSGIRIPVAQGHGCIRGESDTNFGVA